MPEADAQTRGPTGGCAIPGRGPERRRKPNGPRADAQTKGGAKRLMTFRSTFAWFAHPPRDIAHKTFLPRSARRPETSRPIFTRCAHPSRDVANDSFRSVARETSSHLYTCFEMLRMSLFIFRCSVVLDCILKGSRSTQAPPWPQGVCVTFQDILKS